MKLKIELEYKQVLEIVKQLSDSQIQKLLSDTQSLLTKPRPITEQSVLQKKLLIAPTMTEEQYKDFVETRKYFNKWRTQ